MSKPELNVDEKIVLSALTQKAINNWRSVLNKQPDNKTRAICEREIDRFETIMDKLKP